MHGYGSMPRLSADRKINVEVFEWMDRWINGLDERLDGLDWIDG